MSKGLTYRISSRCVKCGTCAAGCPERCIIGLPNGYVIGNRCVSCGTCYNNCPVGAVQRIGNGN